MSLFLPHRRLLALGRRVRIAGSSLAYALGDSRTAQNIIVDDFGNTGNGASWARQLTNGRLRLPFANINGGSGETLATIRSTRFPSALASTANVLILLGGVNRGASQAQDIADITYMAQTWAASAPDRVTWVFDELCPDGTQAGAIAAAWDVPSNMARHVALRDAIRALSAPSRGIYVVPSWRSSTGGNDGTTADPLFYKPSDGLHCSPYGAFKLGKLLADTMMATIPPFDPYAAKTFSADQTLNGGNFTGPGTIAAAGLAISGTGHTAGTVSDLDGDGVLWASFTLAGTADATISRSTATLPSGVTPGATTVQGILKYRVSAGLTNIRGLSFDLIKQSGTGFSVVDGVNNGSAYEFGDIPFDATTHGTLLTEPVLVPADATQVRWRVIVQPERIGGVSQSMAGTISLAYGGLIVS